MSAHNICFYGMLRLLNSTEYMYMSNHNIPLYGETFKIIAKLGPQKNLFVSGHPTDPNSLGTSQTIFFFWPSGIFKSIFRLFLKFFVHFQKYI